MRISADPNDSGYTGLSLNGITVYLNGVLQSDVVTADDAEGYVLRAIRTKQGMLTTDSEEIALEEVSGNVDIRVPRTEVMSNA